MNQFTKTTIVNSFDEKNFLKLLGVKPEYVCAVYRHDGCWGRKEKLTINLNAVEFSKDDKAPEVIRLEVRLHTVGAHLGEFQNALTRNSELFTYEAKFDKDSKDGKANMAKALATAARNHRNTSKNFDFEVTADDNGKLTFTAGADYIRFKDVFVNEVSSNLTGYEAQLDKVVYTTTKEYDDKVITLTPGMNGFGDTAWIINNFQLPTYVNTNWMALHQDERPIPGKLYNQFTIHAVADRGELTGMGAVGQKMASKTTHVFYVLAENSKAFTDAMTNAGIEVKVENIGVADQNNGTSTPFDGKNPMDSYKVPAEIKPEGANEADVIYGDPAEKDLINNTLTKKEDKTDEPTEGTEE